MVEETFVAPNPREAFELAKEKYGHFSDLKLLRATQIKNDEDKLVSKIVVSVPEHDFLESIGIDDAESSDAENSEIDSIRKLMLRKGLSEAWLDKALEPFCFGIPSGSSTQEGKKSVLSSLLEEIDESITVQAEDLSEKKVMMFIGATGVGKTTTIAKLASRYAYKLDRPLNVALINLDTFRSGAYEQLEHHAQTMQIKHIGVEHIEDFSKALDTLRDYDVILVDTAGISPYDTKKLIKTIEFLKSVKNRTIDIHLVVSATAKYDDIMDIHEHFSFMDINSVILTKFDETKRIGELFGFLIEKQVAVSYVSSGQQVPEDLEPASKEMLLERFAGELDLDQ